jgi:hypothetical protein
LVHDVNADFLDQAPRSSPLRQLGQGAQQERGRKVPQTRL